LPRKHLRLLASIARGMRMQDVQDAQSRFCCWSGEIVEGAWQDLLAPIVSRSRDFFSVFSVRIVCKP